MEIIIQKDRAAASRVAAELVARLIGEKPAAVLGLATGDTPLGLYAELIRRHRDQGLDFSRVRTFNLDEYVGLAPDHPASYNHFMRENLFDRINLPRENIHLPNGVADDLQRHCLDYEAAIRQAGGIDVQVLGIGSDGHIGFNEPTSSLASRTRIEMLTDETRRDNARFFPCLEDVPRHAITMGVGTILDSRICLLMAFGAAKAEAVARMIEGPVSAMVPASALQLHPRVHVLLDADAAEQLSGKDHYRHVYENKYRG